MASPTLTQYVSVGVTREAVYTALASKIQTTLGLNGIVRGWPIMSEMNITDSPCAYLHQESSKPTQKRYLPVRYLDRARLWVFVAQTSSDPGLVVSPSTQLNNLRDLLDTALAPDQGDQRVFTLGGLVEHCWVEDDTTFESISGTEWTLFRTHISVQYFSINNT